MMGFLYECTVRPLNSEAHACALIVAVLVNNGIPREGIVETSRSSRRRPTVSFYLSAAGEAERIRAILARLFRRGVHFSLRVLPEDSWKTRWKRYCRPFQLTPSLRVIPAWGRSGKAFPRQGQLLLDTTSAFGTGLHPTTRMMASLIERSGKRLGDFLDVGTGSGILTLAALRCGATRATAIDSDRDAVATARLNMGRNRCAGVRVLRAALESFPARRRFDFVAANLLTDDLLRLRGKLCRLVRPGGALAVSGILKENYPRLRRGFGGSGLRCERVLFQKNWCALLWRARSTV